MPLSWNEIKSRAAAFSKNWADAGNEDSQAKPFLIDFFEVFGIYPESSFYMLLDSGFCFQQPRNDGVLCFELRRF